MKQKILYYIGFIVCYFVSIFVCPIFSASPPLKTLSESEILHFQMLVNGNNRFAFDLYQRLKQEPGNIYFSSYSIVTGLGMVSLGAKGDTAVQFQQQFRYSLPLLLFNGDLNALLEKEGSSKSAGKLILANALWIDSTVKVLPSFTQALKTDYRDAWQSINFSGPQSIVKQKINEWTLERSKGKVYNILSQMDVQSSDRMILTTAAYVQGAWAYPFERTKTKKGSFNIGPKRSVNVQMMTNTADYLLKKEDTCDLLAIPYETGGDGPELSLVIILPKKEVSLQVFEGQWTWENWKKWKEGFKSERVELSLPLFRFEKQLDLKEIFKPLGLTKVFNQEANFSGLTEDRGVFLNAAVHKALIRVEETGSDIGGLRNRSAVTPRLSSGEVVEQFIADRPFLFLIWDKRSDSILFMGRVSLP